jgi:hypothetical protein
MTASMVREQVEVLQRQLTGIAVITSPVNGSGMHQDLDSVVTAERKRLEDRLSAGPPPGGSWNWLGDLESDVSRLAQEAMSLLGGVNIRQRGLDGGLCQMADALVASVSDQLQLAPPPTIPAPEEFIDLLSDVIRVRYPGGSVWDLPVVVHELGHYVAHRLGAGGPRGAVVDGLLCREQAKLPANLGAFAEELFADTFATYVAGPAYGYSCLIRRLAPLDVNKDGSLHPATNKRATAIAATLHHLVNRKPQSGLNMMVDDLEAAWRNRIEVSDGPRRAGGDGQADTDADGQPAADADGQAEAIRYAQGLASEFLVALDQECPVVRFDRTGDVFSLANKLNENPFETSAVAGDPKWLIPIVNAGWLRRRKDAMTSAKQAGNGATDRDTGIAAFDPGRQELTDRVRRMCEECLHG